MLNGARGIGQFLVEGVADNQIWQSSLACITAMLGASHVIAQVPAWRSGAGSAAPVVWGHGVSGDYLAQLARYAGELEVLTAGLPVGRVALQEEYVPEDRYRRSRVWTEVVQPMGGFRAAIARPFPGALVVACRGESARAFSPADLAVFQEVLPHLATALRLKRYVHALEGRIAGLEQACDELETGVVLLDAQGGCIRANRAAAEIMAFPEEGGIRAEADGGAGRRLRDVIRQADGATVLLERAAPCQPLCVRAVRLPGLGAAAPCGDAVVATALFVRDPARPRRGGVRGLCRALGLTPRETEIATLLVSGHGTDQIADALGISVGNLRVHLKHIFCKTGADGRVALVALFQASLP